MLNDTQKSIINSFVQYNLFDAIEALSHEKQLLALSSVLDLTIFTGQSKALQESDVYEDVMMFTKMMYHPSIQQPADSSIPIDLMTGLTSIPPTYVVIKRDNQFVAVPAGRLNLVAKQKEDEQECTAQEVRTHIKDLVNAKKEVLVAESEKENPKDGARSKLDEQNSVEQSTPEKLSANKEDAQKVLDHSLVSPQAVNTILALSPVLVRLGLLEEETSNLNMINDIIQDMQSKVSRGISIINSLGSKHDKLNYIVMSALLGNEQPLIDCCDFHLFYNVQKALYVLGVKSAAPYIDTDLIENADLLIYKCNQEALAKCLDRNKDNLPFKTRNWLYSVWMNNTHQNPRILQLLTSKAPMHMGIAQTARLVAALVKQICDSRHSLTQKKVMLLSLLHSLTKIFSIPDKKAHQAIYRIAENGNCFELMVYSYLLAPVNAIQRNFLNRDLFHTLIGKKLYHCAASMALQGFPTYLTKQDLDRATDQSQGRIECTMDESSGRVSVRVRPEPEPQPAVLTRFHSLMIRGFRAVIQGLVQEELQAEPERTDAGVVPSGADVQQSDEDTGAVSASSPDDSSPSTPSL